MRSVQVILLFVFFVATLGHLSTHLATTKDVADGTAFSLQVFNLIANSYRTETLTKFTKVSTGWQSLRPTYPLKRGTIVQVVLIIWKGDYTTVGVSTDPQGMYTQSVGQDENSWGYYCQNGGKYTRNTNIPYGPKCGSGDYVRTRIDLTEGKGTIEYFLNGNSLGLAWGGLLSLNKDIYFAFGSYVAGDVIEVLSYSQTTPA